MTTTATPHILILGATGGIGQAAAHAFLRAGWRVRALTRRPNPAAGTGLEAVQWLRGDAMNEADVVGAAAEMSMTSPLTIRTGVGPSPRSRRPSRSASCQSSGRKVMAAGYTNSPGARKPRPAGEDGGNQAISMRKTHWLVGLS